MGKGLNLNDFNIESENIISSENKTKNNYKATISKKKTLQRSYKLVLLKQSLINFILILKNQDFHILQGI